MITLKSFQALYWRNRFHAHPVGVAELDVGDWRADALGADAWETLRGRFDAVRGGDVDPAAWRGAALLAAICSSLHRDAYDAPAAWGAEAPGAWFAVADPFHASAIARLAVALLNEVMARPTITAAEIAAGLEALARRAEEAAADPLTRAMVSAASERGVPWFRLHGAIPDMQLGQGHQQRRLRETLTSAEGAIAATYAENKPLSVALLSAAGLPTGKVAVATRVEQAVAAATAIGLPVVLKAPGEGGGGMERLSTPEAVRAAATTLLASARQVMIQTCLPGETHSLLVVRGRLVAAALRRPASVTGDGVSSIAALIDAENRRRLRNPDFRRLMNAILVDDEARRVLSDQGYSVDTVPPAGADVRLRLTASVPTGGCAVDVTEQAHADNIWLAERAAGLIGLTLASVDLITPDISRSWREVGGGVSDVSAVVGLRPYWLANPASDVAGPILETIVPKGEDGRIPTALVTGSNGKTTTVRMLDHILRAAGHVVGSATTDAITVNGRVVVDGDFAGSSGAVIVLREPAVTAAVLEMARGGVLKYGIAIDRCNVAALLNVAHEQVGIDGIETVDEMAQLKRKVVETARDAFVFNALDVRCLALSREFPVDRTILFSLEGEAPAVRDHVAAGGMAATTDQSGEETIVIRGPWGETQIAAVADLPATFGGRVRHNVANALAAAALAHGMGVAPATIADGLKGFLPSLDHSLGRFNFIDDAPVRVLLDFAANPPAIRAAMAGLEALGLPGRQTCMVTSPGNRPDSQIDDCALAVAGRFDRYVCFEREEWRRGRAPGEIVARLAQALAASGVPPDHLETALTPEAAMYAAKRLTAPGDLLVVLGVEADTDLPILRAAFPGADA